MLDVDVFKKKYRKNADISKLSAELFEERIGDVLAVPSKRPSDLPKTHFFFRCDVEHANSKFSKKGNRIHIPEHVQRNSSRGRS